MTLPAAVQANLDKANAIQAQMNAAPAGQADTPAEVLEPDPAPQPEVEIPQATAPQPAEPVPPVESDWERKYKVLQGKYNAEVPRLNEQVHQLQAAMAEMQEQMKAAQKQRTDVEAKSLVTDADREAFGADLVNLAERIAKQQLLPVQSELERANQVIEQLQTQLKRNTDEVQVTGQQSFLTGLAREVPEWEAMNEDAGFLAWLAQPDPVFGVERQTALDQAAASLNVKAAAAVFNAYKATIAAQTPAKPAKSPKDGLQSQVAPSRSRAGTAPESDPFAGKIWNDAEIRAFYAAKREGAYTPEQAARISAEIDRAAAEGRVR